MSQLAAYIEELKGQGVDVFTDGTHTGIHIPSSFALSRHTIYLSPNAVMRIFLAQGNAESLKRLIVYQSELTQVITICERLNQLLQEEQK